MIYSYFSQTEHSRCNILVNSKLYWRNPILGACGRPNDCRKFYDLKRGDLQIELTSPSGTLSGLLHPRPLDKQPGEYVDWPFMSVMFWEENPAGQWTLSVTTDDVTGVAVVSGVEFQFYGVSQVPEAVANIPDQCHSDCRRGCAREGSDFCDSCVNLRNAYTLECIDECPPGYTECNGYCYDSSLPTKQCNSPLKSKEGTGFTQDYEPIGCVDAGFTECCTNGNCASAPFHPFNCFCDAVCFNYGDCCEDVADIGCSEKTGSSVIIVLSLFLNIFSSFSYGNIALH